MLVLGQSHLVLQHPVADDSGAAWGAGATGGFLKTAHTEIRVLVQIFGPKIQAQN